MAASGSISRSALNVASGARTAMASLLCGGFILGALGFGGLQVGGELVVPNTSQGGFLTGGQKLQLFE